MGTIREEVEINASPARVWSVVHGDVVNIPEWSDNLVSTELVGSGKMRLGSQMRYVVKIPGGRTTTLVLRVDTYDKPSVCDGQIIEGPISGSWSWRYTELAPKSTNVVFDQQLKIGGVLRFASGVIERDVRSGVQRNLRDLKAYVEAGKGPG